MRQNALAAGALLGSLQCSPKPLSGFGGGRIGNRGMEMAREGMEGKESNGKERENGI